MDIFTLCGCAVVACVLIMTIKQHRPDIAIVLTVAAGIVLFAFAAGYLGQAAEGIFTILGSLSSAADEMCIVIRALGVCLVAQLAADVCRDCGQATLASKVELGGKTLVLVMLIPLFTQIVSTAADIMDLS